MNLYVPHKQKKWSHWKSDHSNTALVWDCLAHRHIQWRSMFSAILSRDLQFGLEAQCLHQHLNFLGYEFLATNKLYSHHSWFINIVSTQCWRWLWFLEAWVMLLFVCNSSVLVCTFFQLAWSLENGFQGTLLDLYDSCCLVRHWVWSVYF